MNVWILRTDLGKSPRRSGVGQDADRSAGRRGTQRDQKVVAVLADVEHETCARQTIGRVQGIREELALSEAGSIAPGHDPVFLERRNQLIH